MARSGIVTQQTMSAPASAAGPKIPGAYGSSTPRNGSVADADEATDLDSHGNYRPRRDLWFGHYIWLTAVPSLRIIVLGRTLSSLVETMT